MKKSNINLLLVALSSAAVLAACNSGSSPSPTPTPTPTPTPPVSNESGIAALNTAALQFNFSVAPSTGVWSEYTSGTTSAISTLTSDGNVVVGLVGNNTVIAGSSVGGQFVTTALTGGFTAQNFVAYGNGEFVIINTAGNTVAVGTESGVSSTALVVDGGGSTTLNSLTNLNYVNNQFVASNPTATYTSTDGIHWTSVTSNTAAANLQSLEQVSFVNNVYVAIKGGALLAGNSLANLTTTSTLDGSDPASVTAIAVSGTKLYVAGDLSAGGVFGTDVVGVYTPQAAASGATVSLGSVIGTPVDVSGTAATPTSLTVVGSAVYAANATTVATATGTSEVVAAGTAGLVLTANGSNLLVANAGAIDDGEPAGTTVDGNLQSFNGTVWANLASGASNNIAGFAGSTSGYMAVTTDGAVIVSSESGFVPASTITDANDDQVAVSNTIGLSYAAGSYVTGDNTNLYVSADNGATWTEVLASAINSSTNVTDVQVAGGVFYVTTNNGTYTTITPAVASSYSKVTTVAVPGVDPNVYSFGGQVYEFTPNDMTIAMLTNGSFVTQTQTLPANYVTAGNIAGATTFGLAQGNSNYIWTSTSILAGASSWTQNAATFAEDAGGATPTAFVATPQLFWTGEAWVSQVANGTNADEIYVSTNGTAWTPANSTAAGATESATIYSTTLSIF